MSNMMASAFRLRSPLTMRAVFVWLQVLLALSHAFAMGAVVQPRSAAETGTWRDALIARTDALEPAGPGSPRHFARTDVAALLLMALWTPTCLREMLASCPRLRNGYMHAVQ